MMSFRASDDSAIRALRALSREAAEAEVPAIDWDRVERGIFAEIERGERPASLEALATPVLAEGRGGAGSPWTVGLVAAAAMALVVGLTHGDSRAPLRANDRAARTPLAVHGITLGDSLVAGDVVESKDRALAYEKAGLVTFTVGPASRVELLAAEQIGDGPGAVTISLAQGSVHAEVQPQPDGEAFAVEVGRTRVAVHGTSFTVSREGDRVRVQVAHGSVAVGPTGHRGSTQGWLLVGPDQATFSLDGARDAEWLAAPATDVTRSAVSLSESSAGPSKPASSKSATPPRSAHLVARGESAPHFADDAGDKQPLPGELHPSGSAAGRAEQVEGGVSAILSGIESCYERQVSSFGVTFSVRSSLTLSILPSGAVREGVFNPPLSPTLMSCAQEAIASSRFAPGEGVREIRVPVTLSKP
jgi:hypothetical protein